MGREKEDGAFNSAALETLILIETSQDTVGFNRFQAAQQPISKATSSLWFPVSSPIKPGYIEGLMDLFIQQCCPAQLHM